jgi:hypothetical protein
MEKRNVIEKERTPCVKKGGKCSCDGSDRCSKKDANEKQASAPSSIYDIDALAGVHK